MKTYHTEPKKISEYNQVQTALEFATHAHREQTRKYTGEPYIVHPIEVMKIVQTVPHTDEMLCAALLHDVVEDCGVTLEEVRDTFGIVVEDLVFWLTDPPKGESGLNRKARKAKTVDRYGIAPDDACTIKLADLISNTRTIVDHDPQFAAVYMREKAELLTVLDRGNKVLYNQAQALINNYYEKVDDVR